MIGRRAGFALVASAFVAGRAAAQPVHVEKVNVVDAPADVPGRVGAEFTLTLSVTGRPQGTLVTLREVWRPPLPGVRDPASSGAQLEIFGEIRVRLGESVRRSYVFDQPWKIVPGRWQVEYWDGVRKMQSRSFNVYIPQ
jgi:hypothetical protein